MFRHKGELRTSKHNLGLGSLLSLVAGIVNVVGFLAIQRLTTNVTGHFAYFIDEVFKLEFHKGLVYFLYIFFFFLGSFISNVLVEIISKKNDNYVYIIPAILESIILLSAAILGKFFISQNPDLLAFSLLFAMGLQNSLVTTISNAAVRTTHLTGLFTDLGIDLSQLFFYREKEQKVKLLSSVKLRLTIISFFFLGGILGGIFYSKMGIYALAVAGTILLSGIIFDWLKQKRTPTKTKSNK
ncbi:MAG: DUF1275 domain-containing protein [Opitutaceae bacterium]|nr:DUF1275 domain-containing protein [Cytophagales bacterium]